MPSIDNKRKNQKLKILYIFLGAFFITLFTVIYLATALTPKMDIDISANNRDLTTEDEMSEGRRDVDYRLKQIQQDEQVPTYGEEESSASILENMKKMREESLNSEAASYKEELVEPEKEAGITLERVKTQQEQQQTGSKKSKIAQQLNNIPLASGASTVKKSAPVPGTGGTTQAMSSKATKVYVGHYSSFDEALTAQNRLVAASLAEAPFIKNLGTYYVVQVGSYSNLQKAQTLVEKLIGAGYQARTIQE